MNKPALTISSLSVAVGLALAMQMAPAQSQDMMDKMKDKMKGMMDMGDKPQIVKDNMARMSRDKLEKCYGINAVSKNDCAEGAHSCAGQATQARDSKSFVLLPAGDCDKIQGGHLKAG